MEQAIIHVHFVPHLDDGSVEPACPQYGGVQGDRNGTLLSFFVPAALQGNAFRYRIEGEDGAGGFVSTEPLALDDDGNVAVFLDERFTAAGGQILVRLVVSEMAQDNEVATVHSFDGRLFFADAPTANVVSPFRDTLSAMVARTEGKLEDMEALAETLSERVDEFNARAAASEAMLTTHGTRLTAAENALDAAETRMDGHDNRFTADEQTADTLDQWVENLSDKIRDLGERAEMKEEEPTPWQFIQKIVRAGLAKTLFSIGDEFVTDHRIYGKIVWKVVGFDHDSLLDERFSHSMTLQTKDCLHAANGQYDLKAYNVPSSSHSTGFADWETSSLRVWLNSKEEAGRWFIPESEGDTPPEYAAQEGFMRGFSESFLSVIGTVEAPVALNSTYSNHSGSTYDKFYLPSRAEVYGGVSGGGITAYEGEALEAYGEGYSSLASSSGSADTNRVKKLNGTATPWWTRSPNPIFSDRVVQVKADGGIGTTMNSTACGVAPMCCIF